MQIEPIAVVGLAARVPGAGSAAGFWANLLAARNSIHRLTPEQLAQAGEDPEAMAAPNYVPARPLLDDVWGFDHAYFGMSRREAALRNPQHRLFLELCATALQDAGVDAERCDEAIGVYGGCASDRFVEDHLRADPELMAQVGDMVALVSSNIDYLAPFVSYRLGLRGPSISVRTACSTSLVATHLACQALRTGDCDLALAGGVEIETPYGRGYLHVDGGIDSRDGLCRPLDADASGTVFGSGGGVVALKRLPDARADGDRVLALIRGSAVNNDGAERAGFTTPSWTGQSRVIAEAIAVSGVDSASISYVELHGTGTKVGDPIELRGLREGLAFAARGDTGRAECVIGSVKSNLGHLGPASGVVGLIKTVLALQHEVIPPTINVRRLNPDLELEGSRFTVASAPRPWPRVAGAPRRAGISSFGFGGTNAHLVLEEAPLPGSRPTRTGPDLLVWSGVDEAAREQAGRLVLAAAASAPATELAAVAHTSRTGRRALSSRGAVRVADPEEARAAAAGGRAVLLGDGRPRQPVLMFPGQGSQHAAMGVAAGRWLPGFSTVVRRCLEVSGRLLGSDLVRLWEHEKDAAVLAATVNAQPLLFAVELAAARALGELGVFPAAVAGHSVGELVAATVAGVFVEEDALRVVAERARLMQEQPPGEMIAVSAAADEVRGLLTDGVWVCAENDPAQTVIGGTPAAVAEFRPVLRARGWRHQRLATSHAFHTPLMAGAADRLAEVIGTVALSRPQLPLVSGMTGQPLTDEQAASPEFWARQVVEPVLFTRALASLPLPEAVLVEAGPGRGLAALARRHPAIRAASTPVVGLLPGGRQHILDAIGALWVHGVPVRLGPLSAPGVPKYPLASYPYRRAEFLLPDRSRRARPAVAPGAPAEPARPASRGPAGEPDTGPIIALPVWAPAGVLAPRRPATTGARGRAIVLLPDDPASAALVRGALQMAGYRILPITHGEDFEAHDYAAVIRPGQPGDLDRALEELEGDAAGLLVHATGYGPVPKPPSSPPEVDRGILSALQLHRYAARRRGRRLPVLVLTAGGIQITTAEPLDPGRAGIAGIVRTAVLEGGPGAARMLDLADAGAGLLAAEIAEPTCPDPVLAVRGSQLWRPGRVRLPLPDWPSSMLEPEGRYVIAGGLGGVGLVVARGLADTGLQPHLVLVSRNALPAARSPAVRRQLAAIEAAGARLTVQAADVTDAAAMSALFAQVEAEHGPVHGILHAAGVASGRLLANRDVRAAETVLAPKTLGAGVLRELALATASVRFVAFFSSRAALNGLVGSADYAAANAFMDALAQSSAHDRHTAVLSINWPTWHDVGMAAMGEEAAHAHATQIGPSDWRVAEHQLDGRPLLPASGLLDLLVQAVRSAAGQDGTPVEVSDVTLTAPLIVERAVRVEVTLVAADAGWRATLSSRPVDAPPAQRQVHLTARARCRPARRDGADLLGTAARWAVIPPDPPGKSRFTFGPRFAAVRERRRGEDPGVTIGVLELPAEFETDLEVHALHPALLDRALALQLRPDDHIPFAYRRLVVYRDLPARVIARHTLRAGTAGRSVVDAVLFDTRGRPLVEVEGFVKVPLGPGQTARTGEAAPPPAAPAAAGRPQIGLTSGITPQQGTAALLRLLCAEAGPRAMVVPAEEWAEGAPAVTVPGLEPARPGPAARPGQEASGQEGAAEAVRALWAETLGIPGLQADDDFFAVGGDSLTAIQLVSRLQDRFGVELSVSELFDAPSPSALALMIEAKR
jgi:acyl transferase domain-containing protein/NADP-dependent 3-hydroxy acid dehydrogenase YdfG/acyl carrier protein